MINKFTQSTIYLLISILISILLISCSGSENPIKENSGAGINFQLKWPLAKSVGSLPANVTWVKMSVSGLDMNTITKDFEASIGTGEITNVPAGSGRTITFQGLNSALMITYQGTVHNVTLVEGVEFDCGIVDMKKTEPPATPTNLTAEAELYNRIKLIWMDNATNENGFKIERKIGSAGTFLEIGTSSTDATTYFDTTTSPVTTYYYRVRATNEFGNSGYSNEINVITPERTYKITGTVTCEGLPLAGVTISGTGLASITTGSDGYFSFNGLYNGSYTLTPSRAGYNLTSPPMPLTVNNTDLSAVNFSATASTLPATPSSLSAVAVSTSRIALAWTDNANNDSGYKIERSTSQGGPYTEIGTTAADATTYIDGSLNIITKYYYRIRSTNSKGDSPYTSEVNATTLDVISPALVKVVGGTFTMGDTFGDGMADHLDDPTHIVTLGDFYIGKYEVTQEEWLSIMGTNPSSFKTCGLSCPVEFVSWDDVQLFIGKLNEQSHKNYRLPTEAEWEYTARGGAVAQQKFSGTNDVSLVSEYAWYSDNALSTTHEVGTKKPNALGVHDMSGNVYEFVSDWYGSYSSAAQTNPKGPASGSERVSRGGSWRPRSDGFSQELRTTYRRKDNPTAGRYGYIGFRLASSTP